MKNKELYVAALKAIDDLFSDKSVSLEKAIENMNGLRDDIDMKISNLEYDKKYEESKEIEN